MLVLKFSFKSTGLSISEEIHLFYTLYITFYIIYLDITYLYFLFSYNVFHFKFSYRLFSFSFYFKPEADGIILEIVTVIHVTLITLMQNTLIKLI